jgi:hypothetical protein
VGNVTVELKGVNENKNQLSVAMTVEDKRFDKKSLATSGNEAKVLASSANWVQPKRRQSLPIRPRPMKQKMKWVTKTCSEACPSLTSGRTAGGFTTDWKRTSTAVLAAKSTTRAMP